MEVISVHCLLTVMQTEIKCKTTRNKSKSFKQENGFVTVQTNNSLYYFMTTLR